MKHYYIKYPRHFNNEYTLCWVEADSPEEKKVIINGYERITLEKAIEKCDDQRWLAKHDPDFAGYGSSIILPYDCGFSEVEAIWGDFLRTDDKYVYY